MTDVTEQVREALENHLIGAFHVGYEYSYNDWANGFAAAVARALEAVELDADNPERVRSLFLAKLGEATR